MRTGIVYILLCRDNSYYTGLTSNLEKRISEHKTGYYKGYTKGRRPIELVWNSEEIPIQEAIYMEKQIKGWRRKKKEALIAGRWEELIELSKNYTKMYGHPSTSSG